MLQLHVTDDRGAVTSHTVDHLPFLIGRSPQADLQLVAPGVWEEHAFIDLAESESAARKRFVIAPVRESLVAINGEVVAGKELHIGDEITLGATRILVSLAPAKQGKLSLQELTVWALLLAVVIVEAAVIHFAN
jgi:hypothetical protein